MKERRAGVQSELKAHFKPEFLNRVDDIIIFNPLSKEHIGTIVKIQIDRAAKLLKTQRNITLEVSKRALDFLSAEGYDPQFGARPLKREIQRHLLNPLSVKLLEGNVVDGASIHVDSDGKKILFS